MDRTRLGWTLVVVGIVLALVSALAEPLGFGDDNGLGLQQSRRSRRRRSWSRW